MNQRKSICWWINIHFYPSYYDWNRVRCGCSSVDVCCWKNGSFLSIHLWGCTARIIRFNRFFHEINHPAIEVPDGNPLCWLPTFRGGFDLMRDLNRKHTKTHHTHSTRGIFYNSWMFNIYMIYGITGSGISRYSIQYLPSLIVHHQIPWFMNTFTFGACSDDVPHVTLLRITPYNHDD